ncbi:MAG TPA: Gfo/Idh/MocA family oxidoreductase [Gemmataceae bacterium]|nr:Gfo/Idh/MocA family oxidoreductase [Gemmataceae bacterium]
MARLRVAVVGVGHLGKEHARILADLPDVELVGVADVNAEQSQTVARRLGCRAFANYRAFLHLADAAVIAVPTTAHHSVAAEFLRCGIPVLVEKPLAATLEEAESLVELGQRHRALIQVGHIERFNPALERLQEHALQPKFVQGERLGTFTGRSTDIGVVLDLMIHDLDVLVALVRSPVRSIDALGVSIFGGCEDVANARLSFANGCVANLTASRASYAAHRCMQIWGPEGFARLDFAKRHLTFVQPSEQVRRYGLDTRTLDPASRAMLKDELFGRHLEVLAFDCNPNADQLTGELKDFVRCVQEGRQPRVTGEDGRDAMALATRILKSIEEHQWEGHAAGAIGPTHLPAPRGVLFRPMAGEAAA